MTEEEIDAARARRRTLDRAANVAGSRVMAAVLVFVSIIAVSFMLWRQQDQVECNARYNQGKARADAARAEAAEADRQALERMVRRFVDEPRGDERAALDEYLRTLGETDKKRRDNPVPPPPPDLCR